RGPDGLVDLESGVDRHELVTQLVVGCMQAQRERDRDALLGQLVDAGYEAHGADGDAPRGHAEPVGGRVDHATHGADHGLVVGHRLSHTHEHDVGHATGAAGNLSALHRPCTGGDLLDDLTGRHVALQTA